MSFVYNQIGQSLWFGRLSGVSSPQLFVFLKLYKPKLPRNLYVARRTCLVQPIRVEKHVFSFSADVRILYYVLSFLHVLPYVAIIHTLQRIL